MNFLDKFFDRARTLFATQQPTVHQINTMVRMPDWHVGVGHLRPGAWVVTKRDLHLVVYDRRDPQKVQKAMIPEGTLAIFHRIVNQRPGDPDEPDWVPELAWDIHLVGSDGQTLNHKGEPRTMFDADILVEPYSVRLAQRSEIPPSRLFPGLSPEEIDRQCFIMGYK